MGEFFSGLFSSVTGFFTSFKTTLIAVGVTAVIAGGAGWYYGSTHSEKIYAQAAVNVSANATAAGAATQAKQNDTDAKANQADSQKRQDANTKRDQAAGAVQKNLPALVPPQPLTCPPVSAPAMHTLNDPDIIGSDAQ